MIYVNIDKSTNTITFHTNINCPFVARYLTETPFNGVGVLKRDGGWLHFENVGQMNNNQEVKQYKQQYNRVICC